MLTKMNGRGMSRSLSKEQNTLIVHCTLAVLYAERRGNHFFHFHMGNISILFLHLASSRYPCSPKAEKIPFPSWWLAGVALFQLFCSYLVGIWICSSTQWQTSRCCSRPSRILNSINAGPRNKLNIINGDIFIIHGMQL